MSQNSGKPSWLDENLPPDLVSSALFRFKVHTVTGGMIQIDMAKDINVDYEQLEELLQTVPAQYTFWAAVYSEVRRTAAFFERQIRVRKGQIVREYLDASREHGLRPTDKQTSLVADADDDIQKYEEILEKVQRDCGKLYHMVEATKMKLDAARSLAGFKRQERGDHH